jgi:hypothetical protein
MIAMPIPPLRFRCSDAHLSSGFQWAVGESLKAVQTGRPGAMPSYWAGLRHRPMFYSRNVAHQALGAHLLGLDRENLTMLRHFAASATRQRGYYPIWSFTFGGEPADVDYTDDGHFVRETPAAFEIAEKSIEQYRWTGDDSYLHDPAFTAYYDNLVREFVPLHDVMNTGVAGESGTQDIFDGIPSYNERSRNPGMQVTADGIATQWAAMVAIGQSVRDIQLAKEARVYAAALLAHFEDVWWNNEFGNYLAGRSINRQFPEFEYEQSWFPAIKRMISPGPRAEAHLAFVADGMQEYPLDNIEALGYLPEVFFPYGHDKTAVNWIRELIESRSDYPEVPFTIVSHLAVGLAGIVPRYDGALETRSHLIDGWIEVSELPYRSRRITVRHDGDEETTLTVQGGNSPLRWIAHVGSHTEVREVPPGESVRVKGAK